METWLQISLGIPLAIILTYLGIAILNGFIIAFKMEWTKQQMKKLRKTNLTEADKVMTEMKQQRQEYEKINKVKPKW